MQKTHRILKGFIELSSYLSLFYYYLLSVKHLSNKNFTFILETAFRGLSCWVAPAQKTIAVLHRSYDYPKEIKLKGVKCLLLLLIVRRREDASHTPCEHPGVFKCSAAPNQFLHQRSKMKRIQSQWYNFPWNLMQQHFLRKCCILIITQTCFLCFFFFNSSQNFSKYYTGPHQSRCISHAFLNPIIAAYLLVNILISVRIAKPRVFPVWHNIFGAYKICRDTRALGRTQTMPVVPHRAEAWMHLLPKPFASWHSCVLAPSALLYVIVKCSFHVSAAQWRTTQRTWMPLYQLCGCWPAVGCWHDLWPMVSLAVEAIGHVHVRAPATATVACWSTPLPTVPGPKKCIEHSN